MAPRTWSTIATSKLFRSTLATIPVDVLYLHVAPAVLLPSAGLRVGIVWRAGAWNAERSMAFDDVVALLDACSQSAEDGMAACDWLALQFEGVDGEQDPRLRPLNVSTLAATARWMQALDLVITIDSLSAHLPGALGRPVWTLLPGTRTGAGWSGRQPWYPTMRLFRQASAGDWRAVLKEVRLALRKLTCRQFAPP